MRAAGPLGEIVERRELAIHEGRPERRTMAFTRTASGLCVANLHATNDQPALAAEDVLDAGRSARPSGPASAPLLFGGDLNLRPGEDPGVFDELRERFGLAGPTGAARDRPPARARARGRSSRRHAWPPERRELPRATACALRLSDHAPVEAGFECIPDHRGAAGMR